MIIVPWICWKMIKLFSTINKSWSFYCRHNGQNSFFYERWIIYHMWFLGYLNQFLVLGCSSLQSALKSLDIPWKCHQCLEDHPPYPSFINRHKIAESNDSNSIALKTDPQIHTTCWQSQIDWDSSQFHTRNAFLLKLQWPNYSMLSQQTQGKPCWYAKCSSSAWKHADHFQNNQLWFLF